MTRTNSLKVRRGEAGEEEEEGRQKLRWSQGTRARPGAGEETSETTLGIGAQATETLPPVSC